jgi:hypothetical protein
MSPVYRFSSTPPKIISPPSSELSVLQETKGRVSQGEATEKDICTKQSPSEGNRAPSWLQTRVP